MLITVSTIQILIMGAKTLIIDSKKCQFIDIIGFRGTRKFSVMDTMKVPIMVQ